MRMTDGIERSVEVHSTWGTFEWLLHDAFEKGYRVGVVCHSDDHKGRPGATTPGASTFGAIGGLSCYFMPELTRDALFEALRRRRHYGTTGTRLFLDLHATFERDVTGFSDDPKLGPAKEFPVREALMGDIIRPLSVPMKLSVEVIGTAPLERVDVLHGDAVVQSVRPFAAADLGRRVRVLWQGAEYRGRGRETMWQGKLAITGNRIARFSPVNFLNPERKVRETKPGAALAWTSVTTGNLAGIDLWLDDADRHAADRHQCRVGRGRASTGSRTKRSRLTAAGLAADSSSIVCPRQTGATRSPSSTRLQLQRWRRSAGLCACDAGGRSSGVVKPDLPDRLSGNLTATGLRYS